MATRIDDDQAGDRTARWLAETLGVYRAQRDTFLLEEVLDGETRPGDRVLEVCCGSGTLAVSAGRRSGVTVTALDVSRAATFVTRWRALRARVPVRTGRGDLFGPAAGRCFDLVIANPPYVPARAAAESTRGRRAWDGGIDGRALVDRLCREVAGVLAPGGRLVMVQSEFTGIERTCTVLRDEGFEVEVLARCEHPFGPVLHRCAEHLERAGLLESGRRNEELAVLCARS